MNSIKYLNTTILSSFLKYGRTYRCYRGDFDILKYGPVSSQSLSRCVIWKSLPKEKPKRVSSCSDLSLFSLKSEKLFAEIGERLSSLCDEGLIKDVDINDEFINIVFDDRQKTGMEREGGVGVIIISKQSSTKQIWYSSPFRKPDYFEFSNNWRSERTNKTLSETLKEDLFLCTGISIDLCNGAQ